MPEWPAIPEGCLNQTFKPKKNAGGIRMRNYYSLKDLELALASNIEIIYFYEINSSALQAPQSSCLVK
jgi:hypothetical protein